MQRRRFLRATVALGTLGIMSPHRVPAAAPRPPNIVFMMLDDAGIGDFGCYGQELIETPNVDRMAVEGMRFTQAYTGSPVCAPCRCILMTGLHSGHCTRRGNTATAGWDQPGRPLVPLNSTDVTVAAVLKRAGYVTGGFGKWGLGNPGTTGTPEQHGFDHFYGYLDQVHAHSYYPTYLIRDGRNEALPGNRNGGHKQYSHSLIADAALEFVRQYRDRPFFLYLPFTLPHGQYQIPDNAPYDTQPWTTQEKNYAAMISLADRDLARLLDLLKELKLDQDTIVFFTSDNGPNRPFLKRFKSAAGLRGIKRSLYEGGIRMPMVVRWPGHIPAGTVSDFVWTFADFMPTAAVLAGIAPPKELDGMSILPTLLGKQQKPHDMLYWEFHNPFHQALRTGHYKGVRFGTEEPLALYDLDTDPGETTDIAAKHPEIIRQMTAFLATARTPTRYWPARAKRGKPKRRNRGNAK